MKFRWFVLLCAFAILTPAQEPNVFTSVWKSIFDTSGFDGARAVALDVSGNFLMVGQTYGTDTGDDGLVVKVSPAGERIWARRFDSTISGDDYFTAVAADASGNVSVAGIASDRDAQNAFVIANYRGTDGFQNWAKVIPGKHITQGVVGVDVSGNVLATVGVESGVGQIIRTYKISATGAPLWTNDVVSARDTIFELNKNVAMLVASDGGCYVAGLTNSTRGDLDWMLARLKPNGSVQWRITAGNTSFESQPFMTYHSSGDLLLAGSSQNSSGGFDILIQRLNPNTGARVWQTKLLGKSAFNSGLHLAVDIKSDVTGRILVAENSPGSGGLVARFTAAGEFEWSTHFAQSTVAIVPLPGGRCFASLERGVAWLDNDGSVLNEESGRLFVVPTADGAGAVYAAASFFKADSFGDFGLAAEKIAMGRHASAPKFTKLVTITGGFAQQSVELAPEVSGTGLKFFWSHNGELIPGATARTLTIQTLDASTIGYYSLSVTNEYGGTYCPDIEVLTLSPIFTRQPRMQTLALYGDAAFSAQAVGFEPQQSYVGPFANYLTYQWQYFDAFFGWTDLDGENYSKLLIRKADQSWVNYSYRCVATVIYPELGNLTFFAVSDSANLEYPIEGVQEIWQNRNQFLLTGEPWSLPTGMALRTAGGVSLSLQSQNVLYRADINNGNIVSYADETFQPAQSPLPKGPHLPDSQGNYYSIGETNRLDTFVDWFAAKHSSSGQTLWTQTVTSLGRSLDVVVDGVVDNQDNLIISGVGSTELTGQDFMTLCLKKEDGDIRWTASYHDPEGVRLRFAGEQPSRVAVDPKGNAYVAGMSSKTPTDGFYILISYDTNGVQRFIYKRPFHNREDALPLLLAVDEDGSSILAGMFGLVKVDSTGRELWLNDALPTPESKPTEFSGIQLDKMGNLFASGKTSAGQFLAKYDAFGGFIGQVPDSSFPESFFQQFGRFTLDAYGNVYLPGSGGNSATEKDILLVKLDSLFRRRWMARVDGVSQLLDVGFDVKVRGTDVFLVGQVTHENSLQTSLTQFSEAGSPIKITHLTRSQTIKKGGKLIAGVTVAGSPRFYQWYRNGIAVNGGTAATLNIPNVDYQHEGFYVLAVQDFSDNLDFSAGFAIRVAEAPTFTIPPASTNLVVTGELRLSATVAGAAPLSFQWQFEGEPIQGETNLTFVIGETHFSDHGQYRLVVSNEWGTATSQAATVIVRAPANLPPIVKLTQPSAGAVRRDLSPVLLRAAAYDADGRVALVIFRVNGSQVASILSAPFETMWTPPGPGIYKVSAEGFDNHLASGKSAEVELVIASQPTITQQPATTLTIAENSDLRLKADATGTPPPRFQWRLNGANIPGATNKTYTVGGAQVRHSGKYAVVVVNEGAPTISSKTEVIVSAPELVLKDKFVEAITRSETQFTGRGNNLNASKEVGEPNHAGRKGGSSVWLKWKAPQSGVMTLHTRGSAIDTLLAVYTGASVGGLTQVVADDERAGFHCSALRFNAIKDQIYAIAVDGFKGQVGNIVLGWALDSSARELPVITKEPDGVSGTTGAGGGFFLDVVGTGLTFQWFHNGYPLPGKTASGISFSDLNRTNVGRYVLRISNAGGTVESISADLELGAASEPVTQDRVEDLRLATAPEGRAFSSGYPTVSPGIPYQKFFNTAGASTDSDEPILGDGGGASKWYMINAGGSGTLVATTTGSEFPTLLTLHDASNFDTLPVLANGARLSDGSSRLEYAAVTGHGYIFRVDGVDDREGNVVLNVTIGSAPVMAAQSQDRVMAAGESATLTATVSASPVAQFRWYLNGVTLPGKTTATLPITNFDPAQVGMYELEAYNALASARKTVAYLELKRDTLFSPLTRQANGSTQLRLEGNNLTFLIDATTDFVTWDNVFTGHADNGAVIFTEPAVPGSPYRFYRARTQ